MIRTMFRYAAQMWRSPRVFTLFIVCLTSAIWLMAETEVFADGYALTPMRSSSDLSQGKVRVLVQTPEGWSKRRSVGYSIGFGLEGHRNGYPVINVTACHLGKFDPRDLNPKNSYVFANLESEVMEIRRIRTFDSRAYGILPIWRIRSGSDDYFLILIVRDDTEIDISLRGHSSDELESYLGNLMQVARSARIVDG